MGSITPVSNLDYGVTMKNMLLINRLKNFFKEVKAIDTIKWRKNPLVLLNVLAAFIFHRKSKFVVSLNTPSTYKLLKVLWILGIRRDIWYWVIGGSLADRIEQGEYKAAYYKSLSHIIVEGSSMKAKLEALGFNNITWVSNFKPIIEIHKEAKRSDVVHFVFLSRIMLDKGVDTILESIKQLNDSGFHKKYRMDFYGAIEPSYKENFEAKLLALTNVSYNGFLNLTDQESYKLLAKYDVMLFPTYWKGEGFPGVIIDGFIAGLPIIASDWSLNKDIVADGMTGTIVPPKDSTALTRAMLLYINKDVDLAVLSENSLSQARKYDVKSVVSKELLEDIGLL